MNNNSYYKSLLVFIVLLILSGCSNLKYVPPGEQLYTGASINIEPKETVKRKHIRAQLEQVLRPEPNSTFLGLRPKLWFYNIAGENANKGIKKWLKTKLGEPPVYLSQVDPFLIEDLMKSRLDNMGYFKSRTEHEIKSKGKKASIEYVAIVSDPYKLNEITYPQGSDSLSIAIRNTQSKSLIYKGIQYNLDLLKDERARIDNELKNIGYYFFNPDLLVYTVDTTIGDRLINVKLSVKPESPQKALITYSLDSIYIIPRYSVSRRRVLRERDTIFDYGYYFVERNNNLKHKSLSRYIKLKEGQKYSKQNHNLTVSRLMSMGVFSFVDIDYKDTIINNEGTLKSSIRLTQTLPKTLKVDFDIGSKSTNFTGPALSTNFINRNLFKGGELLRLNFNGAYETQLSGNESGVNSWEIGAGMQLVTPRFISPIKIRHESSINIPKTKLDLQLRALHRVGYFDMNGVNTTFGYIWRESEFIEYEVNPIAVNYSKLRKTTLKFDSVLRSNPYLRRTFQEQFTFGSTASFTFNTLTGLPKRDQYFLNLMLDVSGNLASLIHRTFTGERSTDERPYELFGSRFSQYSKLSSDFRYYNNFDKNNSLATRIVLGAGIPYGNSTVMPYSKQFFSGGSNSIRAFLPRSLGPGSYKIPDTLVLGYFDQAGDLKLELNAEFRFGIVSIVKGAVFVDAGNVWLARRNEFLPGGHFESDNFIKEIAVGTGFGLRLDLSFFLLRFDLGIPLRKPYLPENERWVIDEINFGRPSWRNENLVFNIAVGYPF